MNNSMRFNNRFFSLTLLAAAVALWGGNAHAAAGTWTQLTSGGLWSNTANWSGGTVADNNTANFNTIDITADNTVHLDSARTITGLTFGDTVTSSGSEASWILDNNTTPANTLTGISTITVNALGTGKSATISAVITGNTPITKSGNGTLVLSGANTFAKTDCNNATYAWRLTQGTVVIASDSAFGVTTGTGFMATTLINLNGATVQASGSARTVANPIWLNVASITVSGDQSITFSGTVSGRSTNPTLNNNITGAGTMSLNNVYTDNSSGAKTITFAGTGNTFITGVIANNTANAAGQNGNIIKSGNGTLTLSNINTYTGTTAVNGGTLLVNSPGSLHASSAVTVANTAILGGSGTINGTVNVSNGGTIQPTLSGSVGTLTLANAASPTFAATGTLKIRVPTSSAADQVYLSNSGASFACGNLNLVIDVAGLSGNASGLTIVSTAKANGVTGTFPLVTLINNPNSYTYSLDYSDTSKVKLSLTGSGPTTYTVTYDNNGGTGSQTDSSSPYNNGATVTVLGAGSMAKTDCTFGGWNTQADQLGTSYSQGDTFSISGNVTLYAKWISASSPVITTSGTLSAVSTTYGTASATTSFTVSGTDMIAGITVTPPAGFEVTKTVGGASGYAGSGNAITVGAAGTIDTTVVYVRLAATASVGSSPYSGNVTCTSSGATQKDVATASSTVSPATLTLTANNQDKAYGTTQTTPVTSSTAFTPAGLKNGDTVGTVTLAYGDGGLLATDAVGATSTITPSAAAGGSFTAGNYNIGYVAGTLTVIKGTPTATLAVTNSPVTYDGSPHAALVSITASSVPGAVQNILTGGAADKTAAGTYAVTADFVPTDTANYNTLTAHAAGNFIINNPPTSSGGSVTMRLNTTNTFAASNFQFSDADGGALGAIKVVTSLPANGILKLNGTPISSVPSAEILVASIPTLTYTPTANYVGTDSFKFQVRDATAYSADATLTITVTSEILVSNGSFETPGTPLGGPWASFGSPWTITGSPSAWQQIKAVDGGVFASAPDGLWVGLINGDDCPITAPLTQNLGANVSAGDTLSVTFSFGRQTGALPGGQGVAYFDVGGTKYTMAFDVSSVSAGSWHSTNMIQKITNSGNLTLGFYGTSGHSTNVWIDAISNVSVKPEPPRGTMVSFF